MSKPLRAYSSIFQYETVVSMYLFHRYAILICLSQNDESLDESTESALLERSLRGGCSPSAPTGANRAVDPWCW